PLRPAVDNVGDDISAADAQADPDHPMPQPGVALRSAPRQGTGAPACPWNARDEEPQEPVAAVDRHKLASPGVGEEFSIKEARPLHPAARPCQADAECESGNDPAGGVSSLRLPRRIMRQIPPRRAPGYAREDASGDRPKARASAD